MKRLFFPLILILMLAAACQPAAVPATSAPATSVPATVTPGPTGVPATTTPAPTTGPTTGPTEAGPTGTHIAVGQTPAQRAAEAALADTLKITVDKITLVSTEAVDWPDGCLGVQLPGVTCVKGPVPGFRIKLSAGGREYEYHTNQDGTSVLSTQQGFQPLRAVIRLSDDSLKIVDTGYAVRGARPSQGLLPFGGAVGGTAYVLDFVDAPKAERLDASGTTVLPFVEKPNYGLAVWAGSGADQPRLAWATSPVGDPAVTQLFIANVDGSGVRPVLTETVASGQAPYQLLAVRWSDDGQALYFSREPYGIGGYIPFAGASSLYRYSLADGSVTELIPFAPNGGHMICLDDVNADFSLAVGACTDPKTITVHALAGGPDRTITAPGTVTDFRLAGDARFSPDGTRVAFGLAKGDPSAEQGYVAVSDSLEGMSNFIATTDPGHYYTVVAWISDNTLLLQLNTLTCSSTCPTSLWTIGIDGAGLTKLADGTFMALMDGN